MAPSETLALANPVFLSRVRADWSLNSGIPQAQTIAPNAPHRVSPVSSSRVRAERAHKSESAPFLGLFKISTFRPLQSFAEHKFSQVAGKVIGARKRGNARRTTPRPVRSRFKKFSRGTTPTACGVRFWAPGVGATPWAPFAMRGHFAGALIVESEDDFPSRSSVHPLFILCTTATLDANGTPEEGRALAPSWVKAKEPLHTQSLVTQTIAPTAKRQGAGVAVWSGIPKITRYTAIAYSTRISRNRERIRAVFRNTRGVTEYPSTLLTPNLCKYVN